MGYQRDKGNFVTLHNLQVHWNYSWGADLWFRDMFLWYICSLQARWISLTRVCRALCGMRGCHSAPCAQGDCFKRLLGSQIEIKKKKYWRFCGPRNTVSILWLHISMFQLAGNLSGLTARLRRGRSHGRACDKSRKQRGRRSGGGGSWRQWSSAASPHPHPTAKAR